MRIDDSVALATGGSRGLGLAFATELQARGARKVYVGVRNPDGFNRQGIEAVRPDVTDAESVATAANLCDDVTLVVNNAQKSDRRVVAAVTLAGDHDYYLNPAEAG
jgi:NAD(P)-dependent dehydrogenase (short-subunit alcohol dehydrogenase family)